MIGFTTSLVLLEISLGIFINNYIGNQLADRLLFMVCSGTVFYLGNMDPAKIYLVSHQEIVTSMAL